MKKFRVFIVCMIMAVLTLLSANTFASPATVTATSEIRASSDFTGVFKISETTTTFTGIGGTNIEGASFEIKGSPKIFISVINTTTPTVAANNGTMFPSGMYVTLNGGASINQPPDTLLPLRIPQAVIDRVGIIGPIDAKGLGVLRADLVSTVTPGYDIKLFIRYEEPPE